MTEQAQPDVIFCTSEQSYKATVIRSMEGISLFGFATSLWSEGEYNSRTEDPQVVAAVKSLEHATTGRIEEYISALTDRVDTTLDTPVLIHLATDVMVHTFSPDGKRLVHNKPNAECKDDVFRKITDALTDHSGTGGDLDGEITIGCAALALPLVRDEQTLSERISGVTQTVKHVFKFRPFTTEEIADWVYDERKTLDDLNRVNLGVRWEDPRFLSHITVMDGSTPADRDFGMKLSAFLHDLNGVPKSIQLLYDEVRMFYQSNDPGDLTEALYRIADEYPNLKSSYIGRWKDLGSSPSVH